MPWNETEQKRYCRYKIFWSSASATNKVSSVFNQRVTKLNWKKSNVKGE